VNIIRELLDYFLNRKSVIELIKRGENFSFLQLEKEIGINNEKLVSYSQWTNAQLSLIQKRKKYEYNLKQALRKGEQKEIKLQLYNIFPQFTEIEIKYWTSKWPIQKSEKEIKRETQLRKIFSPK
jgi:hypothetical protein